MDTPPPCPLLGRESGIAAASLGSDLAMQPRQLSQRRAVSSPDASAAATAQPGSPSGRSRRSGTPRPAPPRRRRPGRARSRLPQPHPAQPGVSSTAPPPGIGTSARCGGVPAPPVRPADLLRAHHVVPASAFTRLDFRRPERPSRPSVRPAATSGRSGPCRRPSRADGVYGHARRDVGDLSADCLGVAREVGLCQHHDRVAPDSQASASSRSMRPKSGCGSTGSTTAAVSRFAAST